MMEKKKWIRNCPQCDSEISYTLKDNLKRANKVGSLCKSCSKAGENHPKYGKSITEEHKQKLIKAISVPCSDEKKKKISDANKGRKMSKEFRENIANRLRGKKLPEEVKRKIRLTIIKQIEEKKLNGGQMHPNYNPSSIPIIEQKANELGITDLQHAENGGEFFISDLGYWVDGYSKEKNIVIEFDEAHHFDSDGNLIEKDIKRQKEIEKYLGCEFIRISE